MDQLKEGLYDQLVTRELRARLDHPRDPGLQSAIDQLEESDYPDYLARHLARQIRIALHALPAEHRKQRQLELTNTLLDFIHSQDPNELELDLVHPAGQVLRAIYRGPTPPQPPSTPLAAHNLLMNSIGENRLGFELERELATADQVLMIVSFIQWRGWQRLKNAFLDLQRRAAPVRILTTTYIGATDLKAIRELARLDNVQLRISLDGRRRRLHAKAWLFQRDSGFGSVYVGSANLSGPALEDGIEWTVKLSQIETPHIVDRFRGAFDSLWCDPEFELFQPENDEQCRRVQLALDSALSPRGQGASAAPVFFDLRPHPFQQATLDRLESERLDHNSFRNLVVAPTGTGKTLVAAFDFQRQSTHGPRPRLLFLAHREELLKQARDRFRHVLRDESFGDLLFTGHQPATYDALFATVQSLHSRRLIETLGPTYWDYIVLDEAHHVPADSYRDLISSLQPRILLGLTATPERMDGESILPWFDNRKADDMRLWHAIEHQYLVPFDYYGIHDGTDLSSLSWSRGSYLPSELEIEYLNNRRRANLIVNQFCEIYGDRSQARALGFCVSIAHARFMADVFTAAGVPAQAVTSASSPNDRTTAAARLRRREVNVLFTVDLFNEGVDIPEVDCVLFLRPTESSTVFLQQLGRGLRLDSGKVACLVLDFIGNQRREFRFDQKFSALFGGTRQEVRQQLETGITRLPGNCFFRLDKESRNVVLNNLKNRLHATRAAMVAELITLAGQLQHCPSLIEFIAATDYEPADLYKSLIGGWSALLAEAGLLDAPLSPSDSALTARFDRLLHLDSPTRLNLARRFAASPALALSSLLPLEQRVLHMLALRLLPSAARPTASACNDALALLASSPIALREFDQLAALLLHRVHHHSNEIPALQDCPLFLHRQYMRDEIFVALGRPELVGTRQTQSGRIFLEPINTELFFVTLDKSGKSFSPSTRYEDYAISPTRFHWQSQSTTSEASPTGQRYVLQHQNHTRFLLFVRPRPKTPFLFLGPLRYSSHSGDRPMSIYWDLHNPMPAWFFELSASLRAA